jgi:hypothetical protein
MHSGERAQHPRYTPEQRVLVRAKSTTLLRPPEVISAQDPLRQDKTPPAARQPDVVGSRELPGQLPASRACADDQHPSGGYLLRALIRRRVELENGRGQVHGEGWNDG